MTNLTSENCHIAAFAVTSVVRFLLLRKAYIQSQPGIPHHAYFLHLFYLSQSQVFFSTMRPNSSHLTQRFWGICCLSWPTTQPIFTLPTASNLNAASTAAVCVPLYAFLEFHSPSGPYLPLSPKVFVGGKPFCPLGFEGASFVLSE